MSNEKVAIANITIKDLFFRWISITQGFHKLNNQQSQILALFLYYHYHYKRDVTNKKILWNVVFDYDTKRKICDDPIFGEKGLTPSALANAMTHFRRKNVIIDKEISSLYIPDVSNDCTNFKVIFDFNIVDNGRRQDKSTNP